MLEKLLAGKNIALVSDAGLPGISDPGEDLVRLAVEAGVRVTPIPGANAALTALVASGLATDGFMFVGFLPKVSAARRAKIRSLQNVPGTLLFYESPHQLTKTLADLLVVLGDRRAVLGGLGLMVLGGAVLARAPGFEVALAGRLGEPGFIVMTSRTSYELVRKCARLGVPALATISAPTGLALQLAREAGMHLWGLCRPPTAVRYV